jgi:hypothetical protein
MHLKPTGGKHPSNTVNLDPKRVRTLPSLIYFSWDIYRDPTPTNCGGWDLYKYPMKNISKTA